jgi:hypothetical protein
MLTARNQWKNEDNRVASGLVLTRGNGNRQRSIRYHVEVCAVAVQGETMADISAMMGRMKPRDAQIIQITVGSSLLFK